MKITNLIILLTTLFLVACTPKTAEQSKHTIPTNSNEEAETKFPESWVGEWKGNLDIIGGAGKLQTIPMKMSIKATDQADEYDWLTTFGDQAETAKPYLLKTVDAAKGLYIIDEQNSIIIESYLFDQKLVSWYTVMGSLILATFEKQGEFIVFEILAGKEEAVSVTGGEQVDGEDIPAVKTMPFNVMQRAKLSRYN